MIKKTLFFILLLLFVMCKPKREITVHNPKYADVFPLLHVSHIPKPLRFSLGFLVFDTKTSKIRYNICKMICSLEYNKIKTITDTVYVDVCGQNSVRFNDNFQEKLYKTPANSLLIVDKIVFINEGEKDSITNVQYLISE